MFRSTTVGEMPFSRSSRVDRASGRAVSDDDRAARRDRATRTRRPRVVLGVRGTSPAASRASQRSMGSIGLNASGLSVIEMIAVATTMSTASAGAIPRSRPSVGQDERELADLRQRRRHGQPPSESDSASARRQRGDQRLADEDDASAARMKPWLLQQRGGPSSMPTDTKNSTANASRIGSASVAARRL